MSSSSSKHNTTGANRNTDMHTNMQKYKGETVAYPSLVSAALCNEEYISRLYMNHLVFSFIEHICNSSYNVQV